MVEKYGKTVIVAAITIAIVVLIPMSVMALTGGSGEGPGDNCPPLMEGQRYAYLPQPYAGQVTLKYLTANPPAMPYTGLYYMGLIEQFGTGCQVNTDYPVFWRVMSKEEFNNLSESDLRGACIIDLKDTSTFSCTEPLGPGFFQVIAAHGMADGADSNTKLVDVIMMEVTIK
jgi:hypothetical protein